MVGMETDNCKTCGRDGRMVGVGMAAYWTHVSQRGNSYPADHEFVPMSQEDDESESL